MATKDKTTEIDPTVGEEILLTAEGELLVVGGPDHPNPPTRMDDHLVGRDAIGVHKFCGGLVRYIQIHEHKGVVACAGGCNLRIPLPWPMPSYERLKACEPEAPWLLAASSPHTDG